MIVGKQSKTIPVTSNLTLTPILTSNNDGEIVPSDVITNHVKCILVETDKAGEELIRAAWCEDNLDILADGKNLKGRNYAEAICLSNALFPYNKRWHRCAMGTATGLLKSLQWRRDVYSYYVHHHDDEYYYNDSKKRYGAWKTKQIINQVKNYKRAIGEGPLPVEYSQFAPVPRYPAGKLSLGEADEQVYSVEYDSVSRTIILRLRLPAGGNQPEWFTLLFEIPSYFTQLHDIRAVNSPVLRLVGDKLLFDFSVTEEVVNPALSTPSARTAVGLDWGITAFYTASIVNRNGSRLNCDESHEFNDHGLIAKNERLTAESEYIWRKIRRLQDLDNPEQLNEKINVLIRNAGYVNKKRRMIGEELASLTANWALGLAKSSGASIIALEDLSEYSGTGGRSGGRSLREKTSVSVRDKVYETLNHRASYNGVDVIHVDPHNTSSRTPCCNKRTSHRGGWKHSQCECGSEGDRDSWAGANIGKRAMVGRHDVKRGNGKKNHVLNEPHRRVHVRDKLGPTPSRPRYKPVKRADAQRFIEACGCGGESPSNPTPGSLTVGSGATVATSVVGRDEANVTSDDESSRSIAIA